MMNKLEWCFKQKSGIKFVEPNENLSQSYMNESDKTLEAVAATKGKWKVITAYYACYNALYSILMFSGIQSEIHDCSLELMKYISQFTQEDINFLQALKFDRIQAQYYLKDKELQDEKRVQSFVFKCKTIVRSIKPAELRTKIEAEIK